MRAGGLGDHELGASPAGRARRQYRHYQSPPDLLVCKRSLRLVLVGVTVLVALHSIAQGGGVKLKLSSWQGYLAHFLMGIQFLWALPVATVIIRASIYSATH